MGKKKNGICMADGGITKETPEQLMARMEAKYGVSSKPQETTPPVTVQATPKPAAQQGIASLSSVAGLLAGRKSAIDKATSYANGGIVKGKGTPTSDDVPVKIKGSDYNLSDTEAVLPSKTRQALGEMLGAEPGNVAQANKMVEDFIQQTNGKPPVQVEEGTNLAAGGLLDDEARNMSYRGVTGIQAPAPTPVAIAHPAGETWSLGKSGPGATLQVTTGDAARLPAPVVQQGIDTMRGQLAKPQSPAPAATGPAAVQAASPATKPVDMSSGPTVSDGAGGVYTPERGSRPGAGILDGIVNVFKDSAQAARGDKSYEQIRAERAAGQAAGQVTQATGQPMNDGQAALKVDPFGPAPDKFPTPANSDGTFMTGKNGAVPDSSGGGFTQKGTSYNVNPTSQEGITKITSTKTNPLYTNIKPEDAVAGLKDQMVGGNADSVQEGLDRHARANATTQSIIDKQPQGGVGILGDGGVEAANAEKTQRWANENLLAGTSGRARAAAVAQMIAGNNQMATEGMRSATTQRGQDITSGITARGQDIAATNEANRMALESPLKKAQTEGILAQTGSAKVISDLQQKAAAGDQQATATLRALTGKGASASDRFLTVAGGEEIGPDGMTKIKKPSGVFDAQTQRFVPMDGAKQGGFSKADVDAALKSGADKAKIAERIKSMGGNPADFGL